MSAELVRLEAVSKHYGGVRALDRVSLRLVAGETHALIGENGSGKSTLIKILAGVVPPDRGGAIWWRGARVERASAAAARRRGVAVIYQDLALFPNLTVCENIALGAAVRPAARWVRRGRERAAARGALARMGVELPLSVRVGSLSVGDRQLVAIARALAGRVELLVMDEPTAALTPREVASLFRVVRGLEAEGVTTLFVSHKIGEVLEIAREVTALRDGQVAGTLRGGELSRERLAELITGRPACGLGAPPGAPGAGAPERLVVRGLTRRPGFDGVSLRIRAGEIVGLGGRLGSGRTELALALFGMVRPESGSVAVDGRVLRGGSVADAIDCGIGYVPEDRLRDALALDQSVARNVLVASADRLAGRWGFSDRAASADRVRSWLDALRVRLRSPADPVASLSGGNQQRVVLARWLALEPAVLILDNPTAGIDIGAREEIHGLIRELAARGMAVLWIADDPEELEANCQRVLMMEGGRIAGERGPAAARPVPAGPAPEGEPSAAAPAARRRGRVAPRHEWVLALILAALCLGIHAGNARFISAENLLDLLRSCAFSGVLATGVCMVLISGGIDISFTATSSIAAYVMALGLDFLGGNIATAFVVAAAVGCALGLLNALVIHFLRMPPIIATIATLNIYHGLLRVASGGRWIYTLPAWFNRAGDAELPVGAELAGPGVTGLSVLVVIWAAVVCAAALFLGATGAGRGIYAMGGNLDAARRAGYSLCGLRLLVYGGMGLLAGVAAVVHVLETQVVAPNALVGKELGVIAAVVLGGATLTGGRGTLAGTCLGVLLIGVIGNGLTLARIPAVWHELLLGLIILVSVSIGSAAERRREEGGER